MGLIKAVVSGVSSTMADSWKDYFYCDSLSSDMLVVKGQKKSGKKSSNTKGNDNIITNGSVIVVNEGQCMIIVDQGQIVEVCAIPGEYTYDMSTEPSLFAGSLGNIIRETFKTMGNRIAFGGTAAHDQRVYYFNVKEITDNKFGTSTPIPFRVTYQDIGRSFTVGLRCNGVYSYKISNPLMFFTNVCGNITTGYGRADIDNTLYNEFMSHLQPALAKLTSTVRYDELPLHTDEITRAMKEVLKSDWKEDRGIEVCRVAIKSVSIPKEDEDNIKKYEDIAWNRNPLNAAANMVEAQNQAMTSASGNRGGTAMGFYGMNMAQQMGGMNAQSLYAMGQQQAQGNANANAWTCSCGSSNTGKFCANCGKQKPESNSWTCSCGSVNTGKFCGNCGKQKPESNGWTCSCGTSNTGNFCANCGKQKP
ncbi:MAG: SPFH domain-containing protein [Ruminococcus flavefaciens]|nr:SPFH domain-containing protein [Ruminococcus flavefaciens]MCM1229200.1 SPFH domain-containing protein [Ruminococcus flavefaciens]